MGNKMDQKEIDRYGLEDAVEFDYGNVLIGAQAANRTTPKFRQFTPLQP